MSIRDLDREVLVEMSMVDIVYAILKEGPKEPRSFHELLDEVVAIKGFTEEQKLEIMSRLYTEINIDGRFNAMGDNTWGLRAWYPVEQVEEIVITDLKKSKKKRKLADDLDDDYLDDDYIVDEDELDEDLLDDEIDDDIDEIDDIDDLDEEIDPDLDDDLDLEDDLPLEEDEEYDSLDDDGDSDFEENEDEEER